MWKFLKNVYKVMYYKYLKVIPCKCLINWCFQWWISFFCNYTQNFEKPSKFLLQLFAACTLSAVFPLFFPPGYFKKACCVLAFLQWGLVPPQQGRSSGSYCPTVSWPLSPQDPTEHVVFMCFCVVVFFVVVFEKRLTLKYGGLVHTLTLKLELVS